MAIPRLGDQAADAPHCGRTSDQGGGHGLCDGHELESLRQSGIILTCFSTNLIRRAGASDSYHSDATRMRQAQNLPDAPQGGLRKYSFHRIPIIIDPALKRVAFAL